MPARAININTDEAEFIYDADKNASFRCIDCNDKVHVVTEHDRDGSLVRRHFRHNQSREECSASGGESDIHKRRKHQAMAEAVARFGCGLWQTEVEIGTYRADAAVVFDEPHPSYGKGLAIEYQHKNESKDLYAVCEEYAKREFTAVVLWDSQFDERGSMAEVDLFGGTVVTPFPTALPDDAHDFEMTEYEIAQRNWNFQTQFDWKSGCPATLPPEWCDEVSLNIWRRQNWGDLFPAENIDTHIQEVADEYGGTPEIEVKLPPDLINQIILDTFREQPWNSLFSTGPEPYDSQRYIDEVASSLDQPDIKIPFRFCIGEHTWYQWYQQGISQSRKAVERPPNPFNDVQCWKCETYWHYTKEYTKCPSCGTTVDFVWNGATGRIDPEIAAEWQMKKGSETERPQSEKSTT